MFSIGRVPLAWKNLTHDRRRLAVAVGGIAFAVLLMFMQTGFRNALLDSTVKIVDDLNADIVLTSKALYALPSYQRFNRQRIYQARTCPGVKGVYPLYIETYYGVLRRPGHKAYSIRVLAFDLGDPVFHIPQVEQYTAELRNPATAIIDSKSKSKYGVPFWDEQLLQAFSAELADQKIQLAGTFQMGTDFANEGNLIMSSRSFAQFFPFRAQRSDPLSVVDLGVVQVEPGADVQQVKHRLQQILPGDVAVHAKGEFKTNEWQFWNNSTPIGYIFTVGTIMGFVIGVIICYQIIYSNIAEHMAEFATLKAMGYRNRYFISLVLAESLYLSVLGFIPGMLISLAIFNGLSYYTGLLMIMNVSRAAFVYLLTLVMCSVSGCLAMRKVLSVEPAALF